MIWLPLVIGCTEQTFPLCQTGLEVDDPGELLPGLGRTSDALVDEFVPSVLQIQWNASGPQPRVVPLADPVFGWATTARCELDWYRIGVGVNTDLSDEQGVVIFTVRQDGSLFERTFSTSFDDPEISRWAVDALGLSIGSAWMSIHNDQASLSVETNQPGGPAPADYPDSFRGTATW